MSQQIYNLKKRMWCGQKIAMKVEENWYSWYDLTSQEQELWEEYHSGNLEDQMTALQSQKQPKFPCAAQCILDASLTTRCSGSHSLIC